MPYLTMREIQLSPGLVACYDILPGNGVGLFWDTKHTHIFTYLLTFPRPIPMMAGGLWCHSHAPISDKKTCAVYIVDIYQTVIQSERNSRHSTAVHTAIPIHINRQDINTNCEPMKATSNQNASPWTCPVCCMSNVSGMMTSCRSDSDAIVKSMVYFCDWDMHTRMSNVSCTVHLQLSSVSSFHTPGTK